jgi:glycine/D-amino acid oxidase-like deaminating enzyme
LIPIIDHVGPRQFIVAAGFNGHGFTLSPAVGRLLAELVVDGKPSIDLGPFRAGRFAGRAAKVLKAPL